MLEDVEAVERVIAGDREAFRHLVNRHQAAVCATVRALSSARADWEDVAQDVFLAAFQHLATFDASKGSFRTWLLAITRNQFRNRIRRIGPTAVASVPDRHHVRTPAELASEAEWFERLDAGLAALPDDQRLTFVLVELQGLTYQEAADIAETTVGTVKSRLFRAKARLREILEPMRIEDERATASR
ncbi:MAG: sigma-70 family RNA polymerase sigma factor [Planctomycetia bacterium]|nr:sigma-70 family RNA polymerase sigma factor [Planctomycetia bacterium]